MMKTIHSGQCPSFFLLLFFAFYHHVVLSTRVLCLMIDVISNLPTERLFRFDFCAILYKVVHTYLPNRQKLRVMKSKSTMLRPFEAH